ncbi:Hypothetical predicted protein [Podarcis lilfordi]|uniref:Uncharacterized protein n=1 Tax=Podarcis lilfordi TaxID=74358 RepID=A0AA35JRU3_9SAUR|nr:Hypothetical predicted protein [Podarcis lilfordi]
MADVLLETTVMEVEPALERKSEPRAGLALRGKERRPPRSSLCLNGSHLWELDGLY